MLALDARLSCARVRPRPRHDGVQEHEQLLPARPALALRPRAAHLRHRRCATSPRAVTDRHTTRHHVALPPPGTGLRSTTLVVTRSPRRRRCRECLSRSSCAGAVPPSRCWAKQRRLTCAAPQAGVVCRWTLSATHGQARWWSACASSEPIIPVVRVLPLCFGWKFARRRCCRPGWRLGWRAGCWCRYLQEGLCGHPEMAEDFKSWDWKWLLDVVASCGWGAPDMSSIFVGMEGNSTPIHFDDQENIFCQVQGDKEVFLYVRDNPQHIPSTHTHTHKHNKHYSTVTSAPNQHTRRVVFVYTLHLGARRSPRRIFYATGRYPPTDAHALYAFPCNHSCDRQAMVNVDAPDLGVRNHHSCPRSRPRNTCNTHTQTHTRIHAHTHAHIHTRNAQTRNMYNTINICTTRTCAYRSNVCTCAAVPEPRLRQATLVAPLS